MASRFTLYASRLTLLADPLIGLALFLAGLYAYTQTLAPTVLDGDAALFQYTPYVLGVTYPTGYPLYILLGKAWVTLFPFGEIAWRMNLFSALCSAAALPLIYGAARRLLPPAQLGRETRWAALVTVLTFATIPTFWRWSTEAKIYALNILLFSGVLYTLALAGKWQETGGRWQVAGSKWQRTGRKSQEPSNPHLAPRFPLSAFRFPLLALRSSLSRAPLALPALLPGLQIAVHSTTVLLLPGLLLLVWLHFRRHFTKKLFLLYLALLIMPGLLYLYVPLRAEWLLATYGREEAIARGLLADFYHSGWSGWLRYFTAADFTGGVVTNWGLLPSQFVTVYRPILNNNLTPLGVILGVIGGVALAFMRPRLFWPLLLIYALPIPFVLTYGQGEQSAFLLPSFLILCFFIGYFLIFADWLVQLIAARFAPYPPLHPSRFTHHVSRLTLHTSRALPPLIFILLIPTLFWPQTYYNVNSLDAKWSRASYNEWADALSHPLEPGAAMLAHWGDLTSFWYMQFAEGLRPDLRGLYPPTEAVVADYLATGRALYIAGPLQGWAAGIEARYQLVPWGRLVRIAPHQVEPQTLLPRLTQPGEATFDGKLRLLGADYSPQAIDGRPFPVTLTWQALVDLPPETTVSLRLSRGNSLVAQLDDTLLSGWFPRHTLPAGQYVLSYAPIPIPLGTLPGRYRLQLVTYTNYRQPWPLADGTTVLDLGEVELVSPPVDFWPDSGQFRPTVYNFDGEIELVDFGYSVARVGQGKGFAVKLLWRARRQPVDNYTLLVEALAADGKVLRSVEHQPAGGAVPTSSWQPGQFVRDQVDLVIPASAPPGDRALRVRLSWLRPDGARLKVSRWLLPLGNGLNLNWLAVVEKEKRIFEVPAVQQPVEANFENKVKLIGYNSPNLDQPGTGLVRLNRSNCLAETATCQLHFDFYWQGLSEMDQLYTVFLHLVDEEGQIVTQHDRGPGIRAKDPTTSWLPGEVVPDPVDLSLPPDLAPGQYTFRIGLYLAPDGPRLQRLNDEGQAVTDFVEIGTVTVEP